MVAIDERDACEREVFLPEPADELGSGSGEVVFVDGEWPSLFIVAEKVPLD